MSGCSTWHQTIVVRRRRRKWWPFGHTIGVYVDGLSAVETRVPRGQWSLSFLRYEGADETPRVIAPKPQPLIGHVVVEDRLVSPRHRPW